MQSNEDRPVSDGNEAATPAVAARAGVSSLGRMIGTARTAPRGTDSRIGDDETHRRLQEARNRASHSTEQIVRRVLGPEWVQD